MAELDQKVLAEPIQLDNEVVAKQKDNLDPKDYLDPKDNIIIENSSSNQPTIPFIELGEATTYSIPEGNVALTFDDGPSQYSIEIADVLKKYGVGGTFFFIGRNAKKYSDYVQYIQSNGYSIGSHSMNHVNIANLSHEEQENELIQSIKLLEEITNGEIILFRVPFGSFNKQVKDLMHEHQYKMVLWNNDPKDWKTRDADKIFNDIQNSYTSGSIILLHESQAVVDALPRIIEYLQGLDLEIINLK
ncbi:MAG: polysaccharide deacetylase family protein [Firmicutes bacterium]|nr:polysaccharide deacetylase family protein [Bacillota bacterium]